MPKEIIVKGKTFQVSNPNFVDSLVCPSCGASECHPYDRVILIRGFKVSDDAGDWSQCLVCAGFYDPDTLKVRLEDQRPKNWKELGWFVL